MDNEILRTTLQALSYLGERLVWTLAGSALALIAEFEWAACSRLRCLLQGVGHGRVAGIRR